VENKLKNMLEKIEESNKNLKLQQLVLKCAHLNECKVSDCEHKVLCSQVFKEIKDSIKLLT